MSEIQMQALFVLGILCLAAAFSSTREPLDALLAALAGWTPFFIIAWIARPNKRKKEEENDG